MKITDEEKEELKKLIEKRIKSEVEWSWGLLRRPDDQVKLRKELNESKTDINFFLNSL